MSNAATTASNATRSAAIDGRGGFRSQEHETPLTQLRVEGSVPAWLRGSLLRTGPAKWEIGDQHMRHWFDGLAMLHSFSIEDGSVSYVSRFLGSRAYRAAKERGEIAYSEFATDPCRSLFSRVASLFSPKISDNANVNLMRLGERFVAMTETPLPVEFDSETLETVGVAYEAPGILTTAHPHLDRATGGALNYAAKLGPRNSYRFFLVRPDSSKPEVIASLPVRRPAYMHSFGLTERWLVLIEFPYVVNPPSLALSGRPYIENYRWKPELGTRFTLVDRATGEATGPFQTDPFFAFHHVNSYENGDGVVVDICVYPDAELVEDLYMERLRAGKPIPNAELRRFRVSPGSGEIEHERLIDAIELPRINYGRCSERPYRYVWGNATGESGWIEQIVKADLSERTRSPWSEPGSFPGEPVFAAAPDANDEDDGVLLSVVFDAHREASYLLVLDARSLDELARAVVPTHIPYGFHGQFARS